MLVRNQVLPFGDGQHPLEEVAGAEFRQQPVAVGAEYRAVPDGSWMLSPTNQRNKRL
jgi:hypothetical protein